MSDWKQLNKCRVRPEQDEVFGTPDSAGFNGFFYLMLNACLIKCIASDGEGWKHVSVSLAESTLTPSWSIMAQVKDLFWEPEDWVVQFHPAHSEYVNQHPGVLHLWQPLDQPLPKPNRLMVGPRDESDVKAIEADESVPMLQRLATRFLFNRNKKITPSA